MASADGTMDYSSNSDYNVVATNCSNLTISITSNDNHSNNSPIEVEAIDCKNFTIDIDKGIEYSNPKHLYGMIIGVVVSSVFLLLLLMIFVWKYVKRNHRTSSKPEVDTSQAPVARAIELQFRDPPGGLSKIRRFLSKCLNCNKLNS